MSSGTEFLIEIQQRMTGDNPVTELQKTQQALTSAMDSFKDMEKAATQAGTAYEKVGGQIAELRGKMQKAMEAGDPAAFWKMVPALEKLTSKEKELADKAKAAAQALDLQENAVRDLADEFEKLKKEEEETSKAQKKLDVQGAAGGLKKLPGPLRGIADAVEETSEAWEGLSGSLGKGGAAFAVASVAVIAVTAALIAGAAAATAYAVSQADQARNTSLTLEAMFESADAAATLENAFHDVNHATNVGKDRLLDLTRSLKDAGIAASDMPDALQAIATQEVALASQDGTAKLIEDLKSGKVAAADMAAEMENRFGGTVDAKMISLDSLASRLKDNIGELFEDLDIESILQGLDKLVSFFDSSTESGKALKSLIGTIFGPLEDTESIFTAIEGAMLDVIIVALRLSIGAKKIKNSLDEIVPGGLDVLPDAGTVAEAAITALGIAFAPLIAAMAIVIGLAVAIGAAWMGLQAACDAIAQFIVDSWNEVTTFLDGIDLAQLGTDIINGLADGIKAAGTAVLDAITGVVGDAVASAKKLLGIASPSKVFYELGGFTAEGYVDAVEDETDTVSRAVSDMVTVPEVDDVDAPEVRGRRGGDGGAGSIHDNTFIFQGVQGMEDAEARFSALLLKLMQGSAVDLGASTEPEGAPA